MNKYDDIHSSSAKYILTHGIKPDKLLTLTFVDLVNRIFSNLQRNYKKNISYLAISDCWDILTAYRSNIISIFFQEQYVLQQKHISQMLDTYLGDNVANIVQLYTQREYLLIDYCDIKHLKQTFFFKKRIDLYYTFSKKYELERITNYLKSISSNLSHDDFDNARQTSENLSRQIQRMRRFLLGPIDCIPVYNSNMSGDHDGDFAELCNQFK
jgi:hypothetical protein